jgi:hypothetical protein
MTAVIPVWQLPKAASSRRQSIAEAGGRIASYTALAGVLLSPGLWWGPTFDAAAFILVGSGIRNGRMPYSDYWDDKPPGLYVLNALSQAGLPWLDRWLVCWLLTLGFTVVAALILESILRPRVGAVLAWIAALVSTFFVASYPVSLGGGYGESFALPFVLAAVWLLQRKERRLRDAALTGFFLSVACLLSLQAAPTAVVIGLAAAVGNGPRESGKRMIALVLAGVALPVLALGWLAWGGAVAQAYDLLVRYNFAFYRSNEQSSFWLRLFLGFYFLAALWPPALAQFIGLIRRRERPDRLMAACIAWSLASLAALFYEQRIFMHYLILVAPALIIVGAPAFARLGGRLRHSEAAVRRIALAAEGATVALFLTALSLTGLAPGSPLAITTAWHTNEAAVSSWLRANTPASATLFVWGDNPEIYLDSGRDPASPYIYLDPMTTQGYWSPQATADLVSQWQSNPPTIVVETHGAVPLFRAIPWPPPPVEDSRTYDTFDPLRAFVRSNYRLVHSEAEADVWLKK